MRQEMQEDQYLECLIRRPMFLVIILMTNWFEVLSDEYLSWYPFIWWSGTHCVLDPSDQCVYLVVLTKQPFAVATPEMVVTVMLCLVGKKPGAVPACCCAACGENK